jgi:hypothetical protein
MLLRRFWEACQIRRSTRWSAAEEPGLSLLAGVASQPLYQLVCVVPMYLEQDLAVETTRFWHQVAKRKLVDQVLLVTTAKEQPTAGAATTHDLVEAELRRLDADEERIALLRCDHATRFRASQLDLAVEQARARFGPQAGATSNIWVGVYNADSRPEDATFAELRARARFEPDTRVFQQLADYVVPARGRTGLIAAGNAVLQTWWTRSHYAARNARGRAGDTVWSRTAPYSTFGHGEFVRLDFLDDIGGFPDFAYADGLLLGWICRLAAEPIGLLARRDVAEVPRSAADLFTQQTAWMRGLLNFGPTVRWCRQQGVLRLPPGEVQLLRAQHAVIPVAWGLSTLAAAAGIAHAGWRLRHGRCPAYDLAVLTSLVAYPVIPAIASPRVRPLPRSAAGVLASWPLEGLAFWPALFARLRRDQQAPAKTPR